MLVSPGSLMSRRARRGGGAVDPILQMFANGEDGFWCPISPETCYTDTARTTNATVGQAVAAIADLSGNDNHGAQAIVASRMFLRQSVEGAYYLERDPTDDGMDWALQLNGSRWTAGYGFDPDAENSIIISNTGLSAPWVVIGTGGSSSTALAAVGVVLNTLYFNGETEAPATRGEVFTLMQASGSALIDFTVSVDWPSVRVGRFATPITAPGDIYGGVFLINRQLTAPEILALDARLRP